MRTLNFISHLIIIALIISTESFAQGSTLRTGHYLGGSGERLVSFQTNSSQQIDSLSASAPLNCVAIDGSRSTTSVSLTTGAGPVRARGGAAVFRNYRYNASADTRITLNGQITSREVRLSIVLTSPESTCRGSLRIRVIRTTAPIRKNYDSDATDPRGTIALTFTDNKLTTYLVYVLAVCDGITHVITVGNVEEPTTITYESNGNFNFSESRTSSDSSVSVTATGVRNSSSDSYEVNIIGSITNELGTCPFDGSFPLHRI